MPEQNLNPDAIGRMFATAMMEVLDAEKLQPVNRLVHVNDMQEVLNRLEKRILSALPAQPELPENSKPNQNLEFDTVNSVEELEALPAKTVILDRIGDVSVIAETREFMCHDGESYTLDEVSADLPATVLYRPVEG